MKINYKMQLQEQIRTAQKKDKNSEEQKCHIFSFDILSSC